MGYVFDALNRGGEHSDHDPPPPNPSLAETALRRYESARPAPQDESPAAAVDTPAPGVEDDAGAHPTHDEHESLRIDPPVVGELGHLDDRLVTVVDPGSQMAEEYRGIRTALLARWQHKRHLIHTITSATPQEGKTITSLNLGFSFAELRNRRVLVIEADLRLPTFASLLDLDAQDRPGLAHLLRGEADVAQAVQAIPGTRLNVIPAGERCAEAIQLLSAPRTGDLLQTLRAGFDHVIVDTPPVTDLADAGILGAQSDEVLMVTRMNRTPRPLVEGAIRTLKGYGANVAGLIATDQHRSRHKQYYGRYGYHDRYYTRRRAA